MDEEEKMRPTPPTVVPFNGRKTITLLGGDANEMRNELIKKMVVQYEQISSSKRYAGKPGLVDLAIANQNVGYMSKWCQVSLK